MPKSYPHIKIINTQPRSVEGYKSCFDYWKHESKCHITSCCIAKCSNAIHDCATVNIKEEGYGNEWYYVPLCLAHMNCSDKMPIDPNTILVSARKDLVSKHRSLKVIKPFGQSQPQSQSSPKQTQSQSSTKQKRPQTPIKQQQEQQDQLLNQLERYGKHAFNFIQMVSKVFFESSTSPNVLTHEPPASIQSQSKQQHKEEERRREQEALQQQQQQEERHRRKQEALHRQQEEELQWQYQKALQEWQQCQEALQRLQQQYQEALQREQHCQDYLEQLQWQYKEALQWEQHCQHHLEQLQRQYQEGIERLQHRKAGKKQHQHQHQLIYDNKDNYYDDDDDDEEEERTFQPFFDSRHNQQYRQQNQNLAGVYLTFLVILFIVFLFIIK